MTHDERYTLYMVAARDHYRASEWLICRDYVRDARKLACELELAQGETWSDRRRWANACALALEAMLISCGMSE